MQKDTRPPLQYKVNLITEKPERLWFYFILFFFCDFGFMKLLLPLLLFSKAEGLFLVLLYQFLNWYQENGCITEEYSFCKQLAEMLHVWLYSSLYFLYMLMFLQAINHHKKKEILSSILFCLWISMYSFRRKGGTWGRMALYWSLLISVEVLDIICHFTKI